MESIHTAHETVAKVLFKQVQNLIALFYDLSLIPHVKRLREVARQIRGVDWG